VLAGASANATCPNAPPAAPSPPFLHPSIHPPSTKKKKYTNLNRDSVIYEARCPKIGPGTVAVKVRKGGACLGLDAPTAARGWL
jgi:hypothetical protein